MRILIAGASSGCGKTTLSLLLMAALKQKGCSVAPYKVGPDYIDPGFHTAVCGRSSYNLDSWLMKPESLKALLKNDADISVIEGVMGYYDGLNTENFACSTYEIARLTRTPVLLTVDASGGAASVAAVVRGFQMLVSDSGIAGVLVNRVSGESHYRLIEQAIRRHTGLHCFGYLTKNNGLEMPSRHLGLVPADETNGLLPRIFTAAQEALQTLDTDGILRLAGEAPQIGTEFQVALPDMKGIRIGIALDEAFKFYYRANLDALEEAGAELCFFSPLRDASLPEGLDVLYIGGGFPEVFKSDLGENAAMRQSVKRALEKGMRCYAECGGLMYLGRSIDGVPMVDFLPCESHMTERLQRFGYVTVHDRTGLSFPAHEFHHAKAEALEGARFAYEVQKASRPENTWHCGYERLQTLGAFAHVYFADRPELIRRFFL